MNRSAQRNTLTFREKQIIRLVANELTIDEIADHLFLSINTVKTHRKNIMQKLDVRNMAGLVRRGFELGLLHVERVPLLN